MKLIKNIDTASAAICRPSINDNLAEDVAKLTYERQHEFWPHLYGPILPLPAGLLPRPLAAPQVNPFALAPAEPKKPRPAKLHGEVAKVYNAISFAMRGYGIVMNVHLTITWDLAGVSDHVQAAARLTSFNHEAGKWLSVGAQPHNRERMTHRAWYGGSPHMYVYVHENGREQGFHTHQLAFIPLEKAAKFEDWAHARIAKLAGRRGIHPDALCLRVYKPRNEADGVARCWDWFRYITKNLSPHQYVEADDGEWVSARSIFKPRPFVETDPIHCRQLASGSRNIWRKAQRQAKFRSRFITGEWDSLYDGWELEARRQEEADEAERQRVEQMLRTLNL